MTGRPTVPVDIVGGFLGSGKTTLLRRLLEQGTGERVAVVVNELGENMSFSPWHALEEHRPLGGINEARRRIYRDLSKFRHDQNKINSVLQDNSAVARPDEQEWDRLRDQVQFGA